MDTLTVDRQHGVATIRYHNPPRNFMTSRMLHDLRICWRKLEADDSVRVIVLTGDVDDHFSLHTEMEEIRQMMALPARVPNVFTGMVAFFFRLYVGLLRWSPRLADLFLAPRSEAAVVRNAMVNVLLLFDRVQRSSKITVAAINGHCIGGGFELSLCCDYRLMSEGEYLIGAPEILIGMMPGFGGTQRLTRLVGAARAKQILLTGRPLDPQKAHDAGVIDRLYPADEFERSVREFADELATRDPRAVAEVKRAIRHGAERPLREGLYEEMKGMMRLASSETTRRALQMYSTEVQRQLDRPEEHQRSLGKLVRGLELGHTLDSDLVEVAGAAIERDGKFLAARRSDDMPLAGKWEFPGGKIEDGESPDRCLRREIREELVVDIEVGELIATGWDDSRDPTVGLEVYRARLVKGDVELTEHAEYGWFAPGELAELDWADADVPAVEKLLE